MPHVCSQLAITGWKMAPSMYLPYFPILCWTFGHVTSIVTVPKCSNDQQIPWLEIRRIPLLTLKTTWLLWLQFWRNLSLGIHVFFCTGHFNKLKHAVRFWIYCDSIKWDLPATLQGSAPYIVVFWPSRRNIPRRARLRQWVDGSLRFSVFGYCKLMDMFFFETFALWGENDLTTVHDLFSTGLKSSPRLCVVQKFMRPSQLCKWDWI